MRALIVYESMFGNTRVVAGAIGDGVSASVPVDVVEVGEAPYSVPGDVGLLVVGGPTHTLGLTRPATRADAARQAAGPLVSRGDGLREWLESLGSAPSGLAVATFDTRVDKPRVPGSAAKGAARRLRRRRFRMVAPPESFFVSGTTGPLLPGEVDRARQWGVRLGSTVASASAARR